MKVILINGSPNQHGCTYTALKEVAQALAASGIDSEIIHIGSAVIRGCIGCRYCAKNGKCVHDDLVNELAPKLIEADGLVFGSPVYYAGISGQLKSFMDRLFFTYGRKLAYKPAAAVVSARRGGCVSTFDDINRYFAGCCMPIVPSQYWNIVHGYCAEDVIKDEEGLQTMRTLGANMAWMIKCFTLGKRTGLPHPEREATIRTNFIR